jgi:hypothetical protein
VPRGRSESRPVGKDDFSCYRRLALLGTAQARNAFVKALEEVRKKYGFQMVGYVLMPEHVHLLIGESKLGIPYCGAEFEVKSVKEAAV